MPHQFPQGRKSMEIKLSFNDKNFQSREVVICGVFTKKIEADKKKKSKDNEEKGQAKAKNELVFSHWPKDVLVTFQNIKTSKNFKGHPGELFTYNLASGTTIVALGLGDKSKHTSETLRRELASAFNHHKRSATEVAVDLDSVLCGSMEETCQIAAEAIGLANYVFDEHKSKKHESPLKNVVFLSAQTKSKEKKLEEILKATKIKVDAINLARTWVNEPPNFLHSEDYAKRVKNDASKVAGVKVKILGKAELKKEKMGMFLSVNAGSAFEPQLVHLTYTPKKVTSKTKHIALVGKGLTFDTGGLSLKPATSMMNMKFDMAGSATVYAAFKILAMLKADVKVTCVLGITDNAIGNLATQPDSVVIARNGKTVEIHNTDAEGRLVLGDCVNYVADLKPDCIVDVATLTGAVLVSLGHECCGVLGNNQKMVDQVLKCAKASDEYAWQLPIFPEHHQDIKSQVADIKNIGSKGYAGTAKGAVFIEAFIPNEMPWVHLDIAGIGDSQTHLPYCPKHGASGLMVRTLVEFAQNL